MPNDYLENEVINDPQDHDLPEELPEELEGFDEEDIEPRHRKGTWFFVLGLLFLLAAGLLVFYNRLDDKMAGEEAEYYAGRLAWEMINYEPEPVEEEDPYAEEPKVKEMPTVTIDGDEYIGFLIIPEYDLNLPIMNDWSYEKLKKTPCRFSGSYLYDNLVICGHNYPSHFSNMKWIPIGSEVDFLAVDGKIYAYEVTNLEQVGANDVDTMTIRNGNSWDMTLFTCTTGGQFRVAVRLSKLPEARKSWYEMHMEETGEETGESAE